MKVKHLLQKLKHLDPELEVGIKWMHPIEPLRKIGVVKLGRNFKKTKREGKYEYVLLSPFDVDINKQDDY